MQSILLNRIQKSLNAKRESGLYRHRTVERDTSNSYLSFSSNDYLSLTLDERLQCAYQKGYLQYPVGSGGSPMVTGYDSIHRDLEQAFAAALKVDDCMFFSSGYAANLSLMNLLAELDAAAYVDKAAHASIYDGLVMTQVPFKRYRHCDIGDLKSKIKSGVPSVVITESLFSMSGQIAPLDKLAQLTLLNDCSLWVDEAHSFGVMGPEGMGLVPAFDLEQENVPLRVIPLGKAFAGQGAIIAGQGDWIDALLQFARSYRYSTAPSPAMAYGLLQTLDIVRGSDERRQKLFELIAYFKSCIQQMEKINQLPGWTWRDSISAIQQLQIGCPLKAKKLEKKLYEHSIRCVPMRQPTVTKKETGLRVILNYQHQYEDIDKLLQCIYDFDSLAEDI